MDDDIHSSSDTSADTASDVSSDTNSSSDFGGDLAADTGTDLNGDVGESVGDADTGADADSVEDLGQDLNCAEPESTETPAETESPEVETEPERTEPPEETESPATEELPALRDDIKDNPEFVDENGKPRWPENDGFVSEPQSETLAPGTIVDRYGNLGEVDQYGNLVATARYTASGDATYEQRSLPYDQDSQMYYQFEVAAPIEVQQGQTAPAFNQEGGGTQQRFPNTLDSHIEDGSLKPTYVEFVVDKR
ncbi:MAG: glycohydrolase toxin TNT-related protein [Thermoguttaceae bacterium]